MITICSASLFTDVFADAESRANMSDPKSIRCLQFMNNPSREILKSAEQRPINRDVFSSSSRSLRRGIASAHSCNGIRGRRPGFGWRCGFQCGCIETNGSRCDDVGEYV
uniref:Secreted protein n=1 Tax=Knipowitschia caucasica TaxID=637954 RepID=A0AAV2L8R0_KNICA